jgi:hypothetical protein
MLCRLIIGQVARWNPWSTKVSATYSREDGGLSAVKYMIHELQGRTVHDLGHSAPRLEAPHGQQMQRLVSQQARQPTDSEPIYTC